MELLCKVNFQARGRAYWAGSEYELPDELAEWLLRDSPGTFEVVEPEPVRRRLRKPPVDKMLRSAEVEK